MAFILKRYLKGELAKLYCVDFRTLMAEVEPIMPILQKAGYSTNKKILTKRIVRIIVRYIGTPEKVEIEDIE